MEPTKYVWVPEEMCRFGLEDQSKFYRPLRLYLYLSLSSSGMTSFSKDFKQKASKDLDCSVRTVQRNIKPLLKRNWIGKNPKTGTYFIRSFERVREIEGFTYKSAAKVFQEDLKPIKRFQGFCAGVIIGKMILEKKNRVEERPNKNSDVHTQALDHSPNSMEVAANYLKEILGLSKATCHRLKQYAAKYNYIKISPNRIKLSGRSYGASSIWIDKADLSEFMFVQNAGTHYEIIRPDIVEAFMEFRYRKAISDKNETK